MPTSNGFTTPSMPAMAEPGSNRALTATLPSPAKIPDPGSSKIGGSRVSTKVKVSPVAPAVGQNSRTLPVPKMSSQVMTPKIPLNKNTQQQRISAIQSYVGRLGSGKAESPAAFLQSIAHLF